VFGALAVAGMVSPLVAAVLMPLSSLTVIALSFHQRRGPARRGAIGGAGMTLIYLILPVTFLIAAGFVFAFVRAARSGQFDDLTTPAIRATFREPDPTLTANLKPPSEPPVVNRIGLAVPHAAAPFGATRKGIHNASQSQ
jgi:cbb3-type cytochrome oxidase maturation protein